MASRPKIVSFMPKRVLANQATIVYLSGQEFVTGATLVFGALTPVLTVLSDNRASFNLPNTVTADVYDVILTNPDGGRSNTFEFEVEPNKSAREGYIQKLVDQREQPLPPPLQSRTDSQRVASGSQFNGHLPDADQGRWLDGSAPSQGGRWAWAEDCNVTNIEFLANGAEPLAGRLAGSGFFKVCLDGSRILLLSLDGARANVTSVVYEGTVFRLNQGEEIQLITLGATLEMRASITVQVDRPYL